VNPAAAHNNALFKMIDAIQLGISELETESNTDDPLPAHCPAGGWQRHPKFKFKILQI